MAPRGLVSRGAMAREILPWADPYVAQLIKNLQDEVRIERRMRAEVRHYRVTEPNLFGRIGDDGSSQCGTVG
jgi:hypothetical protein